MWEDDHASPGKRSYPHFYAGKLEGNVLVGGQEMQQTPLPKMSRIVGSVFQNPRTQFFHLDTTGEMAFNLENQKCPPPADEEASGGGVLSSEPAGADGPEYF